MKKIFFLSVIVLSLLKSSAQVVFANPTLGQVDITATGGLAVDKSSLLLGEIYLLKLPISNLSTTQPIPAGTCKIKIGLGTRLILDPTFNLTTTNTSSFFDWIAENQGGQVQLTGDLKVNLPPNFSATADFLIKCNILGTSTITANFLITNHNSPLLLSDTDPSNNTSFVGYTIVEPVPVTFTGLVVQQRDCMVKVDFFTENEINVSHYEIEASVGGNAYQSMGKIPATQSPKYSFSFQGSSFANAAYINTRVKSIDRDGKFQYSEIKTIKARCDNSLQLILYPNPASTPAVTIEAISNNLNGPTTVLISDISGRDLRKEKYNFINTKQFTLITAGLPAGQYHVKIIQNNNPEPIMLRMQKL